MSVAWGVSLSSHLAIVARQTWLYPVTIDCNYAFKGIGECQCIARAVSLLVVEARQHAEVPF